MTFWCIILNSSMHLFKNVIKCYLVFLSIGILSHNRNNYERQMKLMIIDHALTIFVQFLHPPEFIQL